MKRLVDEQPNEGSWIIALIVDREIESYHLGMFVRGDGRDGRSLDKHFVLISHRTPGAMYAAYIWYPVTNDIWWTYRPEPPQTFWEIHGGKN